MKLPGGMAAGRGSAAGGRRLAVGSPQRTGAREPTRVRRGPSGQWRREGGESGAPRIVRGRSAAGQCYRDGREGACGVELSAASAHRYSFSRV